LRCRALAGQLPKFFEPGTERGPDTYDFCKDKPIELIDGGGLLYLLQQVGIEARIVFPEE